jgi:branched-chain amino acid transport system substrate-binding protein
MAHAQYSEGTIKIGVMNDMSGLYSDISGRGSVVAARMAVEDFGAVAKGMKVEILGADHQNKPDVGSNIVRSWIDVDKVDVIVDVPTSSIALAGERDCSRKEQGIPRLGCGSVRFDRAEMLPEYCSLDLRHLGDR